MPLLALLGVCSLAFGATSDDEIKQLKEMIKAQNAKIEKLEKAQGATAATAAVDKAVASRGNAYLAPDRPDIKGTGLTFTGEYLYWKVNVGDNTYAYLDDATWNSEDGKAKTVEMGWDHGFRVGLSYRLPWDGFDVGASYTYFRTEGKASAADDDITTALYPAAFDPYSSGSDDCNVAIANMKFKFDSAELLLSRNTQVSKALSAKLFGGFKLVNYELSRDFQYFGDDFADPDEGLGGIVQDKVDALLYGVKAGASGEMKLNHGFSLVGSAAASLLTGKFNIKSLIIEDDNYVIDPATEIMAHMNKSVNRVVPVVELEAGVAWERKLLDNLNLKVFVGYQFTQLFDVVNFPRNHDDTDEATSMYEPDGNLGMHGLVFRIRLDF